MVLKNYAARIAFLVITAILFTGCLARKKVPNLEQIFARARTQEGKRPVIIIPGILGSELVNPKTNERVWLSLSVSKDDDLSLPISPNLEANRDGLVPRRIIETARVFRFFPEISVYQSLISAMQQYGNYKEGDWDNPQKDGDRDTFYVFAYDWRRDNVENGRLFFRQIEDLKRKLGKPDLRFNVIAHSMGGLVTRYAAMYGDRDLPANDVRPVANWSGARHFNKVFMFGVPNEGSMSSFKTLLDGYQVPGFTGKLEVKSLNAETAFSSPAVFQLLPHQISAKFYDENLKPIEVDLYDPETWRRYGWAAISRPTFVSRFSAGNGESAMSPGSDTTPVGKPSDHPETSVEDLNAYFETVLRRAKAFHTALAADTAVPAGLSFFAFGSDCQNTLDGAILVKDPKTDQWNTIMSARSFRNSQGVRVSADSVRRTIYSPGDSSVTRTSLLAETIAEQNSRNSLFRTTLPVLATFFCEDHGDLPNSKVFQNNFLTALIAEITF